MRHVKLFVAFVVLWVPLQVLGHDMFLVVSDHDLPANAAVTLALYNGTFDKSENSIDRERMIDVSVVDGAGVVHHPESAQWRDDENRTLLDFRTGAAGTYVVGVSTRARTIELSAEEFNEYLRHDGVVDVLRRREQNGELDDPARERYSKHVKTILQVGGATSDTYARRLGYPIEIVPQTNPAGLDAGDVLSVLVLADGKPAADQLVYASHAGFHQHGDDGSHREAVETRTDGSGVARIEISGAGRWYVRLIRMLASPDDDVDYESNWATLTFEVP